MKKIVMLMLVGAGFWMTGCAGSPNPTDPVSAGNTGSVSISAKFGSSQNGAPGLSKAPMTDFTTGSVVLTKGAATVTAPITIANGRASVTVSALESGSWNLTVNFYNQTGNLTFTGTTTVVVQNGVTTSVSVTINATNGSISFDFELPMDGNDFVGNFLDPNSIATSIYWENNNLRIFNGGGTTTGNPVSMDRVETPEWVGYAILSSDKSTITWYRPDGSLVSGTGTPWTRQ